MHHPNQPPFSKTSGYLKLLLTISSAFPGFSMGANYTHMPRLARLTGPCPCNSTCPLFLAVHSSPRLPALTDAQHTSLQWHSGKDVLIFQPDLNMTGTQWYESMSSTQWVHKSFSAVFIFPLKTFLLSTAFYLGWWFLDQGLLFTVCKMKSLLSTYLYTNPVENSLEN